MRVSFLTTVATAIACVAASTARAANLVTYPFSNNLDAQVSAAAGGVTASGFLGNGSEAVVGMGDDDGSYAYILITKTSTNVGNSVANKQFAQFTVTPPPSSGMQLAQIQVSAARGGDSTPRGLALRWSFDGYTQAMPRKSATRAELLTPPLFVEILLHGFQPRWHPSAEKF